ncbi:MAG: universal stress protein [Acidobacteria bacterium]|nr:universal stress protein [Acidobacteriota bacterium]
MKILIATDGSNYSDRALEAVVARPWPTGSELRVISVLEHSSLESITAGEYALKLDEIREEVRQMLKQIASSATDTLSKTGCKTSYVVREGLVAQEILEEASEWDADLIVLGTHGRKGLSKFLLGSVAQRVASHAKCSVEIVRKPEHSPA